MSLVKDTGAILHWSVLTAKRPGLSRDLPPGQEKWTWVANSSTLISGAQDAVLVDTFLTTEQSQTLLDWVVASGKNLIAIYITHGHGDHFFGLAPLLARFPFAKALAIPRSSGQWRHKYRRHSSMAFGASVFPVKYPTACWWLRRSPKMNWS